MYNSQLCMHAALKYGCLLYHYVHVMAASSLASLLLWIMLQSNPPKAKELYCKSQSLMPSLKWAHMVGRIAQIFAEVSMDMMCCMHGR